MINSLLRRYWYYCFLILLISFIAQSQDMSKGKIIKKKDSITISAEHLKQIAENFRSGLQNTSSLSKSSMSNFSNATQSTKTWNIAYNRSSGTPRFISDIDNKKSLMKRSYAMNLENNALTMIASNQSIFKIKDPFNEFKLKKQSADADSNVHLCFSQVINNIPIWGKEITFHFRSDGSIYSFTGNYVSTQEVHYTQSIDSMKAISLATGSVTSSRSPNSGTDKNLQKLLNYSGPIASKTIWLDPYTGKASVTWVVDIRPNFRDNWIVFIDIQNGNIINRFNRTANSGSVKTNAKDLQGKNRNIFVYNIDSSYYMIDASRPIWSGNQTDILNAPKGALWTVKYGNANLLNLITTDNIWKDSIAVSAHYNAGLTFQYFYDTFKRKSFNDSGATILSVVHYPDWNGGPYDNAFWNGQYIAFGDGLSFKPFAGGLDVVAHEISHAVVQYTVDLIYQFQSGALNESFADIFASMVDRNDWLIGEDISNDLPLRNMENPEQCGQPSHMKDYFYLDWIQDNGGVHYNSGIPNNAFFRLAKEIGKNKAEQIFYKILASRYLNSQSEFIDLRYAAIQSARDLYNNGAEVAAVEKAFDAVGIFQDSIDVLHGPLPQGSSWITAIHWTNTSKKLHIMSAKETDSLPKYLTLTNTNTSGSSPYSINKDGNKVIFIDYENNIRCIDLTSSEEYPISSDGYWSSLALSPDGKQVTAITTMIDSSIYLFNISEPSESRKINLNTLTKPLPEIAISSVDAIEWSKDGNFLIFDCSCKNTVTFDTHWDIGLLNIKKNTLNFPVTQNGNSNVHYCNPSFAKTNDNLIIFEMRDLDKSRYETQTLNLSSGKITVINSTDKAYSYPVFCDNDSSILYQNVNDIGVPNIWKMLTDGTKNVLFASNYIKPSWLSVGSPSNVITFKKTSSDIFNNGKVIMKDGDAHLMFTLKQETEISFTIFDSRGRKVSSIPASQLNAGEHQVPLVSSRSGITFGSGFYFCKCRVNSNNLITNKTFQFNILH